MAVLLILFVLPLIGLLALSRVAPLFHPRFLIGTLPIYWLLFSLAADASPRLGRALTWALVAWLAVVAFKVSEPSFRPWPVSAAVTEIEERAEPADIILADNRIAEYVWWELDRVLHRERTLHVFRARERGLLPMRELRGNNILPYTDLKAIDLSGIETVWLIHSRRFAYNLAADHLAELGFELSGPEPAAVVGPARFVRPPASNSRTGTEREL